MRAAVYSGVLALAALAASGFAETSAGAGPVAAASAGDAAPATVVRQNDIIFATGATESGGMPLGLDLYAPSGDCAAPRPVVIFVHGGGFTSGDKVGPAVPVIAEALAGHGISTVSIQYRLQGDVAVNSPEYAGFGEAVVSRYRTRFGPRVAAFVAAAEDTVAAMRWVEEHGGEHCLDSARMGLWGASAGGMTVLNVAYALDDHGIDAPRPLAVVEYYGQLFLDGVMQPGEPPLMIVHGDDDEVVAYRAGQDLAQWSEEAGIAHSFVTVAGGRHGFRPLGFFEVEVAGRSMAEDGAHFLAAHLIPGGSPDYTATRVDR